MLNAKLLRKENSSISSQVPIFCIALYVIVHANCVKAALHQLDIKLGGFTSALQYLDEEIVCQNSVILLWSNKISILNLGCSRVRLCKGLIWFLWSCPDGHLGDCRSSFVCVMCSRLMFRFLVCFLSLLSVIISLFLSSCVCQLSMIILCIYSPVCSVWFRLVYLLLPGVPACVYLALSCPALFGVIKDCHFELHPRLHVPRSYLVYAPWQRQGLHWGSVSGAHLVVLVSADVQGCRGHRVLNADPPSVYLAIWVLLYRAKNKLIIK